jgi:hypothetical protein
MRKLFSAFLGILFLTTLITSCETLQNLPTNTTGGAFSLNGTWRLNSSTQSNAMVGSTIQVVPIAANASLKSIQNNTYCARENDVLWRGVKSNGAGGFTLSTLVNACNGSTVYNDATVTVINADQITVTSRTATNSELIQDWRRVVNQ